MSAGVTRSRILVGVDGSSASDAAVPWAAREAAMRRRGWSWWAAAAWTRLRNIYSARPRTLAIAPAPSDHLLPTL